MVGAESDVELAARARAGDRAAFGTLVRRHHPRALRLCALLLADAAEAEDAAQEAFLKAYRGLAGFQGDAAFSTWLHRIAVRHCLDRNRSRSRRRVESLDALVDREGDRLRLLLGGAPDPSRALEAADLAARLLAGLPPDQRAALVLRETAGMSYAGIAEALGCSLDAVKARLRRAREAMVEALRHFPGLGDV